MLLVDEQERSHGLKRYAQARIEALEFRALEESRRSRSDARRGREAGAEPGRSQAAHERTSRLASPRSRRSDSSADTASSLSAGRAAAGGRLIWGELICSLVEVSCSLFSLARSGA